MLTMSQGVLKRKVLSYTYRNARNTATDDERNEHEPTDTENEPVSNGFRGSEYDGIRFE